MFVAREISAGHKDLIHDVSYDYHGRRMATCSSDQSVKVWDLGDDGEWKCTANWKVFYGFVYDYFNGFLRLIIFLKNSRTTLVSSRSHSQLWAVRRLEQPWWKSFQGPTGTYRIVDKILILNRILQYPIVLECYVGSCLGIQQNHVQDPVGSCIIFAHCASHVCTYPNLLYNKHGYEKHIHIH